MGEILGTTLLIDFGEGIFKVPWGYTDQRLKNPTEMTGGGKADTFICGKYILIVQGKEDDSLSNSNKIQVIHNRNSCGGRKYSREIIFVII